MNKEELIEQLGYWTSDLLADVKEIRDSLQQIEGVLQGLESIVDMMEDTDWSVLGDDSSEE